MHEIVNQVKEGNQDALIAYAELKAAEKSLKAALAELEPLALEEAAKYGKTFELYGHKFEQRNGAIRYTFSHLPQWQAADNAKKLIEQQSKQALKAMETGNTIIDADGCIVEPPKVLYSKDSLIVKS